ncbi:MazG nucleotide pyrophosphohydrolase domain-containing protein [Streptomyces sp. NPDC090054]|uniref:MazG nucleotide pyrophosphohydrolase domain-containing protein n=1 Tax=Streptomyces sp. NPDC090054 TaxID=3365933 RepID=UPI003814FB83
MTAKLVRDRIPEIAAANGQQLEIHTASLSEAAELLVEKLAEEAAEVAVAGTREDLLDELADVLEVVHSLADAAGWSPEDVEAARVGKRAARGGFDWRLVLTTSDDESTA